MTDDPPGLTVPAEYELLRRNSRRAAVVSVVCGFLILAALGASVWQVVGLQTKVADLRSTEDDLKQKVGLRQREIAALEARKRQLEYQNERAGGFLAQDDVEAARAVLEPAPIQAGQPASASPAVAAEARRVSVPRIYFQIRSRSQVSRYQACVQPLRDAGARVPPHELLDRGPSRTELRYFHAGEEEKARELQTVLQQCLGEPVALSRPAHTNVNPLHFEVWLAAPSG